MGNRQTLHLPHNSYILADGGYPSVYPLITPFRRRRGGDLGIVQRRANRELARVRVRVEHRIGDARVYRSVPGRSGRFRNRRHFLPAVTNTVVALVNRRRRQIVQIRDELY